MDDTLERLRAILLFVIGAFACAVVLKIVLVVADAVDGSALITLSLVALTVFVSAGFLTSALDS